MYKRQHIEKGADREHIDEPRPEQDYLRGLNHISDDSIAKTGRRQDIAVFIFVNRRMRNQELVTLVGANKILGEL